MKVDTNSNSYTIIYASVMVIIVAFLLAFVASSLKDIQDANVERDTKNQILISLNVDASDVDSQFEQIVEDKLFQNGELVAYDGPFNTSYGAELKKGNLHVFVAKLENGETKYVIPMTGRGLWGGLWGYLALNEDKQTVYGAYFSHESETAGLGALIAEKDFQSRFLGKNVYKDNEVALTVVKNGAVKDASVEVDGVTGATLTSNGVAAMVNGGLKLYKDFLGAAVATAEVEEVVEETNEGGNAKE